jgi:hypothetical protein
VSDESGAPGSDQVQALMADTAVTDLLDILVARGLAPGSVMGGALHAVVRFNIRRYSLPPSKRVLLEIMIPAISAIAEQIFAAPKSPTVDSSKKGSSDAKPN